MGRRGPCRSRKTQTGNRAADFAAANGAAGLQSTPRGYTWHHHQDGRTMQLVPPTSIAQSATRAEWYLAADGPELCFRTSSNPTRELVKPN